MVSSDFCKFSYHFVLLVPNYQPIFQKWPFSKKGAKFGFFNFQCFKFKYLKFFFCLLKQYKIGVSATFLVFLLLREKREAKKIDSWNF